MIDLMKKGIMFGLGLAVVSKDQIEKLVDELVKKGEVSQAKSKELVNTITQRGEEQQQKLNQMIREQIKQLTEELHLATKDDIHRLEQLINKS
jgi:polyhydroxyalkanoate synthesis regulator phasin